MAQCKHCSKLISVSATTNMWRHMKDSHPLTLNRDDISDKPTNRFKQAQLLNDMSLKQKTIPKITQQQQFVFDQLVVDMVIQDLMPLNTVEKTGFQSFVAGLKPGYVLPSRGKFNELLDTRFDEKNKKLMEMCHVVKYLSYTTDLWKSAAKDYYISIALHFIDDNWKLCSPLICTTHVKGSHKKDLIGKLVAEKMKPFIGPFTKIHSGVTDGGELASVKFTEEALSRDQRYLKKDTFELFWSKFYSSMERFHYSH